MSFMLSQRSLGRLDGVKNELHSVVCKAIKISKVDFGVICGMRTQAEQKALYDSGASQTMKSKHLTGDAVDLMAYLNGRASWEISFYDDIADAIKEAAIQEGVSIKWGAAWSVEDIRQWESTMEEAMNNYVDLRRSQGRRPFIDGPHFELS